MLDESEQFFEKKKSWSKYKDLILDYYLKPYLTKIARLSRPIAIIDCFAGPGIFGDGENGSPVIISNRLHEAHARGVNVLGIFIEKHPTLFRRLEHNMLGREIPIKCFEGDFHNHLEEIEKITKTHSVFLYVDPFKPSQIKFNDLSLFYDRLHSGNSVETLFNFMSFGFARAVEGVAADSLSRLGGLDSSILSVREWDDIAGGTYWQQYVLDDSIDLAAKQEMYGVKYAEQFAHWFKWIIQYPIREKYDSDPKYHLIFGSRLPDAIGLMNDAMVKARRDFVGVQFANKDMLFDMTPDEEIIDDKEICEIISNTIVTIGRTTWKLLRLKTIQLTPCKYKESEINNAIKKMIRADMLASTVDGRKIEDEADLWLASTLR